ncbi:MAG TPA: hypothetical protein VJC06_00925 [Candidatus Paceibacterota bacterium]
MSFNSQKFSKTIGKLVEFKSGTTRVHINSTSWEELIWATLVFLYGEEKIDWDSQSHEKSVDIKANINGKVFKISAKSGSIKNGALTISSYRLTTFNNLADKLRFIKNQHENLDFYLTCSKTMQKEKIIYTIIKIKPNKLAPDWMTKEKNWTKTKTGYQLKPGFDFKAKIVTKMSNQLWYTIPVSYVKDGILKEVEILKKNLGKELIKFLNNLPKSLK